MALSSGLSLRLNVQSESSALFCGPRAPRRLSVHCCCFCFCFRSTAAMGPIQDFNLALIRYTDLKETKWLFPILKSTAVNDEED